MKTFERIGILLVVLAVCGFVSGVQTQGLCQEEMKQIVAELQKMKNDAKPFTIKLATMDKKDTYKIGEEVSFVFTADRDCYLYIVDIGTSGKAHILFPNKWQKANKAVKGKRYAVPHKKSKVVFRVKGPVGTNYLKAIATLKPMAALGKTEAKPDEAFAELTKPTVVLKDVGVELARTKNWAEAELAIKVVK
jgi:Domain of unknown function (DUF4384)